MSVARLLIFAAMVLVLGVPFLLRPPASRRAPVEPAGTLVIVTPHVPQIQREFEEAFDRWHRRVHGSPTRIDWRQPGGTSEIIKVLEAHFQAAAKAGAFEFSADGEPRARAGATSYDLMFGGGSFEFGRLKRGIRVTLPGPDGAPLERTIPLSAPAGFSKRQLDEWFGDNRIGAQTLYDPDQHWLGVALSGFGIVYNKDSLDRLGLPEPTSFRDLADGRYYGQLTFADPRQSGSVTTTLDAILSLEGWDAGWRLLRELCGNTRYYSNSSPKPPIDVSQGEAAAGLAIDFYGRGQSQAVLRHGQDPADSRVGYVDPKGAAYIDADPIAILRGGPNPALARRFVEFCPTEEAQSLWQFRATSTPVGAKNPEGPEARPLGPRQYELRRMPVRRLMYERYAGAMIDRVNPFAVASDTKAAGWRAALPMMMGAFAVDNAHGQRAAWGAILRARGDAGFPRERLVEMEGLYYAFPPTRLDDGRELELTPETFRAVSEVWRNPSRRARCEIEYAAWYRTAYERILELGGAPGTR